MIGGSCIYCTCFSVASDGFCLLVILCRKG